MAYLLEHAPDLPVAPLDQRDLVPRVLRLANQPDPRRRGLHRLGNPTHRLSRSWFRRKRHAAPQPLDGFCRGLAADLHHVRLRQVRRGVHQPFRERAIVGHQQQALAIEIQPAHRIDARAHFSYQVHYRRPALWVGDGGHASLGLVHYQVNMPLRPLEQLPVHANVVALRIGLAAQFADDLPIHRDAPLLDHLLGVPARRDPGGGNDFL